MDRSLQQLEGIEYLSSEVSIVPELFDDVEINEGRPRTLTIRNQLNIKFDISFKFGEKDILCKILSDIPYLQNIMNGTSYILLANLIESYYGIQREIYEGNLKGDGVICFGVKNEEFVAMNTKISKWYIGNKIGDSNLSIYLSLKNSFSDRKYECVLIANDEDYIENEGHSLQLNRNELYWEVDAFSDFNATDWPLSLSVYNDKKWSPEFICNQFMFMLNECVINKIEENVYEFHKNNGGGDIVKDIKDIFDDEELNGNINISSTVWDSLDISLNNIKPFLIEWITHLFTDECVYDYDD